MQKSRIGFILSAMAIAVSVGVICTWLVTDAESSLTLISAMVVAMVGLISCANHLWHSSGDKTPS